FWIHLDVDVLQDSLMPCVDHSQPGGLTYRELGDLLRPLLRSALVYGIDITIYNPVLDNNYHAAKEFVRNFKSWLA
ncbi:MAG TPA: arginase family protein, partial [Puia sp.]